MRGALRETATVLVAILVAMAVGSALILAYGESPAQVYGVLLARTWGDLYGVGQVLFKATPLLFTGLAVALAFHAGLFNIGAEGQLVAGSFAAGLAGAALAPSTPAVVAVPFCLLCAALAGAAVGFVPGLLKARFGAHEVITTIMLNFIVQAAVLWMGRRFVFVEQTVRTEAVASGARLPSLGIEGSAASFAVVLGLVAAFGVAFLLYRTRPGFELRALGKNPEAARAAGISPAWTVTWVMTLSGALAGLVASGTVLGYKGYYEQGLGSGAGFMGIAVALLARNHPIALVLAALFFGTLSHGGLAVNAHVPKEMVDVLQAVVILAVAAASGEARRLLPSREGA